MTTTERAQTLSALNASDSLDVVMPDDPRYDAARMTWNSAYEHRPLAVVFPATAAGVIETVNHARASGLRIGIQSTGHGPICEVNDGILINLTRMKDVRLDIESHTAWVEGGAKWQAVVDVVAPHGLAPLLGSTPDVGAVGYTLGGGLGWLARKYGACVDSVRALDVVTADGRLVRASNQEYPDLFWALRGAGAGHLGVVTGMEIELYPVKELYAGNLFYPASMAREVMRRWRDWLPSVPEDLTSAVTLTNYPHIDEVPSELRGTSYVQIRGAFDGPSEQGEELLSYWRDWRQPEIDAFGPLPFSRVAEISDDPLDPFPNDGTGLWMHGLSDSSIEGFADMLFPASSSSTLLLVELRHAGGALARGSATSASYANRQAAILLEIIAELPSKEALPYVRVAIAMLQARIYNDLTGGAYLNFIDGIDRRHSVTQGIGTAAAARLAAVKQAVDPNRLFDYGLDASG